MRNLVAITVLVSAVLASMEFTAGQDEKTGHRRNRLKKLTCTESDDNMPPENLELLKAKVFGKCMYQNEVYEFLVENPIEDKPQDVWFVGVIEFPPDFDIAGKSFYIFLGHDYKGIDFKVPTTVTSHVVPVVAKVELGAYRIPGRSNERKLESIVNRIDRFRLCFVSPE